MSDKRMERSTRPFLVHLPRLVAHRGRVGHIVAPADIQYVGGLRNHPAAIGTICHTPSRIVRWATPDTPTCRQCLIGAAIFVRITEHE